MFGKQSKASLKRLQELSSSGLPIRCVQVLAKGDISQAREHIWDKQGHLKSACAVATTSGWAIIRPDGYLADTGQGVNGDLLATVATSLCLG